MKPQRCGDPVKPRDYRGALRWFSSSAPAPHNERQPRSTRSVGLYYAQRGLFDRRCSLRDRWVCGLSVRQEDVPSSHQMDRDCFDAIPLCRFRDLAYVRRGGGVMPRRVPICAVLSGLELWTVAGARTAPVCRVARRSPPAHREGARSPAASPLFLNRRALHRSRRSRTRNSRPAWGEAELAVAALVEEQTGIGGHRLCCCGTAMRARHDCHK